jgi:AraC family transcriptional regulator
MDNLGTSMDNIGLPKSTHLLSRQVVDPRYFFLDLSPGTRPALKLAFGGRERCAPDYRISRRHFGYYGLEYVAAGHGWATLDGRRSELRPGSVFSYSPEMHCEMGTVAGDPMTKYFFCFTGRVARDRLRQAMLATGAMRTVSNHAEIRTIAEDLIREGQRTARHSREICSTLFDLLLLKLADTTAEMPGVGEPARQNFIRCKDLIDAEVTTLRNLDEIAKRVGLEKSSVCRLFRRFLGTSPYQYLLRQKMNRAAESLLHHGGLVKEVAGQMGFSDPFHFSRGFKAVHGKSPSKLRGNPLPPQPRLETRKRKSNTRVETGRDQTTS